MISDFKAASNLTYGFVGLGLMGGSFAKSIRENILCQSNAKGTILACDKNPASLKHAIEDGIISKGYDENHAAEMLSICDVVFICLYPHATLEFIKQNKGNFKTGSIVTDISGVKTELVEAIPQGLSGINPKTTAQFIPGHPMAGSEKEGYLHSSSKIFAGRNYILMPYKNTKPENLDILKSIIYKIISIRS